jgi:hypothetical protein
MCEKLRELIQTAIWHSIHSSGVKIIARETIKT